MDTNNDISFLVEERDKKREELRLVSIETNKNISLIYTLMRDIDRINNLLVDYDKDPPF